MAKSRSKSKANTKARETKPAGSKPSKLEIGSAVRHYRANRGLTTTALAKKVGISQAQISRLENNQQGMRSGTITRIAKTLSVPVWAFFMTEDERKTAKRKRMLKEA